jgi:hypothetical protein
MGVAMSFSPPVFNLQAQLYTGGDFSLPPRAVVGCNLAFGRRVTFPPGSSESSLGQAMDMQLLLPAGTDIRGLLNADGPDGVQCPPDSGRYYVVDFVDDAGKGFSNEHRVALLAQSLGVGDAPWPTPIP